MHCLQRPNHFRKKWRPGHSRPTQASPTTPGSVLKPSACDSVLPRSSTMGGLSLRAKTLSFRLPISRGQLDCHPGGLFCTACRRRQSFMQSFAQARGKIPTIETLPPEPFSTTFLIPQLLSDSPLSASVFAEPPCACTELWESIFPWERGLSVSLTSLVTSVLRMIH